MSALSLGAKVVGSGAPCYVIAEAGANHDRDLDKAYRLIDVAVKAGADAIKFQTYSGERLYSTKAPRFDYLGELGSKPAHELLEELSLPREWQPLLANRCRSLGLEFLSTPFDRQAVDELDALDVAAFKVASFELVDLPFLSYIGACRRPVILSTGMATLGEIDDGIRALREAGTTDIALLQCASLYPAPPEVMNLRSIVTMAAAFGVPVGLSDHTLGIHVAPAAVAMGASLVEKHFTLDRSSPGPDHPFAVEPDELALLISHIRDIELAMGNGIKQGPSELEAREMYTKARRSIVAAQDIPAGTKLTRDMLTVKRPGHGIKPKYIDALVGRIAVVAIEADDVITWDML
jgi:sialic acid synthase SpsE